MEKFIGTKIVHAEPMTRGEYNIFRGWQIPADENPDDPGYKVVYSDDYVSWSPADAFDEAYRQADAMPFGLALEAVKKGKKVARKGWNGKGQYIFLAKDIEFRTDADLSEFNPEHTEEPTEQNAVFVHDALCIRTSQPAIQVGWLASQSDMLADDWYIVE